MDDRGVAIFLGLPWWAWLLIIALVIIIVAWRLISYANLQESGAVKMHSTPQARPVQDTDAEDDLRRIEGIGPKISGLLKAEGIKTFEALAASDIARLEKILEDANLRRLADPATWPEQAHLAALGDWTGLEKLQDELKGGRRV